MTSGDWAAVFAGLGLIVAVIQPLIPRWYEGMLAKRKAAREQRSELPADNDRRTRILKVLDRILTINAIVGFLLNTGAVISFLQIKAPPTRLEIVVVMVAVAGTVFLVLSRAFDLVTDRLTNLQDRTLNIVAGLSEANKGTMEVVQAMVGAMTVQKEAIEGMVGTQTETTGLLKRIVDNDGTTSEILATTTQQIAELKEDLYGSADQGQELGDAIDDQTTA